MVKQIVSIVQLFILRLNDWGWSIIDWLLIDNGLSMGDILIIDWLLITIKWILIDYWLSIGDVLIIDWLQIIIQWLIIDWLLIIAWLVIDDWLLIDGIDCSCTDSLIDRLINSLYNSNLPLLSILISNHVNTSTPISQTALTVLCWSPGNRAWPRLND